MTVVSSTFGVQDKIPDVEPVDLRYLADQIQVDIDIADPAISMRIEHNSPCFDLQIVDSKTMQSMPSAVKRRFNVIDPGLPGQPGEAVDVLLQQHTSSAGVKSKAELPAFMPSVPVVTTLVLCAEDGCANTACNFTDHIQFALLNYLDMNFLPFSMSWYAPKPIVYRAPLFRVGDHRAVYANLLVVPAQRADDEIYLADIYLRGTYKTNTSVRDVLVPIANEVYLRELTSAALAIMVFDACEFFTEVTGVAQRTCKTCRGNLGNMKHQADHFMLITDKPCIQCVASGRQVNSVGDTIDMSTWN